MMGPMATATIGFGIVLIVLGLAGYFGTKVAATLTVAKCWRRTPAGSVIW